MEKAYICRVKEKRPMSTLNYDIDEIRSQMDYLQLLARTYKTAALTV